MVQPDDQQRGDGILLFETPPNVVLSVAVAVEAVNRREMRMELRLLLVRVGIFGRICFQ